MPTRTTPRRSTAQAHGAGRFARPLSVQRPPAKARKKQSGGMLATAMSALPTAGSQKKKGRGKGGSSKTGPAVGLLMAGAGAFLGRRQMRKRRAHDATDLAPPAA